MTKIYGYIYKITNLVNNKIYIGQTIRKNPLDRFKYHVEIAAISSGKYDNGMVIVKAIRKYGKDNFLFEVIDKAYSKDELNKLEGKYINQFRSLVTENGYNILLINADGRPEFSKETKLKLSNAANNPINLKLIQSNGKKWRRSKRLNKKSKSSYLGVEKNKNNFCAFIKINNIRYRLGIFTNEIDAAKASDIAELKYFNGEILNFPELKNDYLNDIIQIKANTKSFQKPKIIVYSTLNLIP